MAHDLPDLTRVAELHDLSVKQREEWHQACRDYLEGKIDRPTLRRTLDRYLEADRNHLSALQAIFYSL